MNKDLTIDDLKQLAGIEVENKQPKTIVFIPDIVFAQELSITEVEKMRSLLDKLKEIEGSVEQNWTEVYIDGFIYRVKSISHYKPTDS